MDDRWRGWIQGAKRFRKDAIQMVEAAIFNLGGDITKESEEMQIEALKEAYEELKKEEWRGISFPQ